VVVAGGDRGELVAGRREQVLGRGQAGKIVPFPQAAVGRKRIPIISLSGHRDDVGKVRRVNLHRSGAESITPGVEPAVLHSQADIIAGRDGRDAALQAGDQLGRAANSYTCAVAVPAVIVLAPGIDAAVLHGQIMEQTR
jgi:hypothetical protein